MSEFTIELHPDAPQKAVYLGLAIDPKMDVRAVFAWQNDTGPDVIVYAPSVATLRKDILSRNISRATDPDWPPMRDVLEYGLQQVRYTIPMRFMIANDDANISCVDGGQIIAVRVVSENPGFTAVCDVKGAVPERASYWCVPLENGKHIFRLRQCSVNGQFRPN